MEKVTVPPLEGVYAQPWSLRRLLAMMSAFGPAAIVASVSIGAGETIVVVRLGAWSGYDLLWLILLSVLAKSIFVTYLVGRYTAVSGEYIGHRLVHLPGPRGWLLITLIVLELSVAPLAWVAISKPCGDLVHHLFLAPAEGIDAAEKIWENGISTLFIAVAMLFGIRLSFERLEKQQLAICGILVIGTMVGTLMVRPDFVQSLLGSFGLNGMPDFPSWAPADAIEYPLLTLAPAFGYVGGGVFTYLAYSNWVGLHRWGLTGHDDIDRIREHAFNSKEIDYLPEDEEQVSRLRQLIAPLRWDVGLGAIVLFGFLYWLYHRSRVRLRYGQMFAVWLVWYGFQRLLIDFTRLALDVGGDRTLGALTWSQWSALASAAGGVALFLWLGRTNPVVTPENDRTYSRGA